jgi:hypothetical protein
MMKKCFIAVILFFISAVPLGAQDYSKMEAYGGFLLLHDEFLNEEGNKNNYLGVIGAFELNVKSWFGIVGEFGYGNRLGEERLRWADSSPYVERSQSSLLVGPRFGYRGDKFRFFGHVLIGVNRESANIIDTDYSGSNGDPAIAPGFGLDISINDRVSIRPVQFDLIGTVGYHDQIRYLGGVVIKFGTVG